MRREVQLLLCAVQFLTRIPVPSLPGFEVDWITRSAKYFPLVGQLVGGLCGAALLLSAQLWAGWVPVVIAVTIGVLLTGAFHEDGLADTADGLGGGRDREHRLTIMKDSRVGTYGVLALVCCLAIKIAVLTNVSVWMAAVLLLAAHGTGRAAAVVVMHILPYSGDLEAAKIKPVPIGVTRAECILAVIISLWPLVFLTFGQAAWGILCGALAALMMAYAAKRLIQGHTGDVLGATEQVFEIGFLLGASAVIGSAVS
jgi:adenosylcobinamide-GDP ribazoletransferase